MKFNKKLVVLAAAGALSAATAVPAMAFENEFHGMYKLKYFISNYETGGGGPILYGPTPGKPVADDTTQNLKTNNYFEQRARLFYTAKANDDLKLVTGFEIDSVWGDYAQSGATRNQGGALESDAVNLETKWVYLDFKIPGTPTRTTVGIQPFKDQLKGIFLDADVAGIMTKTSLGATALNVGYLRLYDNSYLGATGRARGMDDLDVGVIEAKYAVSKDLNVGGVYYLYADSRRSTTPVASAAMIHTVGLTADAKVGALALSGFAAYQGGVFKGVNGVNDNDSAYLNALAYNVAAKMPIGPGSLRTALLFTSGNAENTGYHLTGWVGTSQSKAGVWSSTTGTSTYNESGMLLLNRNAAAGAGTTDSSIVYNTGNGTNPGNMQGLYLYTLGYDATITPKCYANLNVGFAWTAHNNSLKPTDKVTNKQNASNFMGTEVNIETGYKMYDNLTAVVQAGYVILGGYYKNSVTNGAGSAADPENPYTARLGLNYLF
ncbi:MAG: hypothetical protein CXR30_04240 [Geobacter sp.]|nr:MAG: hypothetical protein CXR30_04240 [Geobacter sp.]